MKSVSLRILSIAAALSLLLTACASSGGEAPSASAAANDGAGEVKVNTRGLPIVAEPVVLKGMCMRDAAHVLSFGDLPIMKAFEEETNVRIEWEEISASAVQERVNLAFAGDSMPDLFYGVELNYNSLLRYSSQGSIVPLNDLIEEYAPNLTELFRIRPDIKQELMLPDGNIYGISKIDEKPLFQNRDQLFINKAWLDQVGKDVPVTTDEFADVLRAFKNAGDLNGNGIADEIPFSFCEDPNASTDSTQLNSMFGSFGIVDTPSNLHHLFVKGGKLEFVPVQEEYRKGLEFLHGLYAEGLLDNEGFTQTYAQYTAKASSNMLGAFVAWQPEWFVPEANVDDYICLMPLKGPDGSQMWFRYPGVPGMDITGKDVATKFAVTSKCKYPEVAIRWIDYVTTGDNNMRQYYGIEGVGWKWRDDGKWERLFDPDGKLEANAFSMSMAPGPGACVMMTWDYVISKQELPAAAANKNARELEYRSFYPEEELPALKLTMEENDMISRIKVDISGYVDTMKAKFISEGVTDQAWQDYRKRVNELGLEQYMQIYEQSFRRMK